MPKLMDAIEIFTEWMLDEEGNLAMMAALSDQHHTARINQIKLALDTDAISTYGPLAFAPEMIHYIEIAADRCPDAPIPSAAALEALGDKQPWLALQKEEPPEEPTN